MSRTVGFFVVVVALLVSPGVWASYHIEILDAGSAEVGLTLEGASLQCSEVDFWHQSVLALRVPELDELTTLTAQWVSNLFDGPCDDERDLLLAVHDGVWPVTIEYELQFRTSWGVLSEGSVNEEPYCHQFIEQRLALDFGLDGEEVEWGGYSTGLGGYGAKTSVRVGELPYSICVELYGEADDDDKSDRADISDASSGGCSLSASGAGTSSAVGCVVIALAVGLRRRRRRV